MILYLLKFSACLAIFLIFYKLILERESMHHIKRYVLLGALVLSLGIPLITFHQYVEPVTISETSATSHISFSTVQNEATTDYLPILLWSLYGLGVLIFGIKFIYNLTEIVVRIKHHPKQKTKFFIHVLMNDLVTPHTFFNYIFLNKRKFETKAIPQEVFWHEEAHATQKHSFDVLFIEILKVIFWFNPLIYLMKQAIKLNHEFLADQAVLNKGIQPSTYQQILLAFSSNVEEPVPMAIGMANAINYSSIKKRFTVMKTHTTKNNIWLRSFLLLPLIALTLYGFSETKQIEKKPISSEKNTPINKDDKAILSINENQDSFKLNGQTDDINGKNAKQQKATSEEVAEYNKLAKHYNSQSQDHQVITLKDMTRINELHNKMSKEQRANAEPFPNFPPPPPPTKGGSQVVHMPDLPPPPPIPADATLEQKKKYQKAIDNYNSQKEGYTYQHKTKDGKMVDVVVITDGDEMVPPPPPPPPKSPLEHIKEMAKKGASFYYEGKSISSDEAIKLLKNNDELNISTKQVDSKEPKVYISKEPIIIKD